MKICYMFSWNFYRKDGVTQKIENQVKTWIDLGHEVVCLCITNKDSDMSILDVANIETVRVDGSSKSLKKMFSVQRAYKKAYKIVEGLSVDVVYYRYSYPVPSVRRLLSKFTSVVEINGPLKSGAKMGDPKKKIQNFLFAEYIHRMSSYALAGVDGVVAVTEEIFNDPVIKSINKKGIEIPNSVDLSKYKVLPSSGNERPKVMFMSSYKRGLEIERLKTLASEAIGELDFCIIGPGEIEGATENMECHGFLSREEFTPLLSSCDLGLSRLGMSEAGLKEGCNLKVRETVAWGLPIALFYYDVGFRNATLNWVLQSSEDKLLGGDATKELVKFAYSVKNKRVKHEESAQYIGAECLEQKRLNFIQECVDSKIKH